MESLDALRSVVAIAETPGELGILDELVASARRLLGAHFGIALLTDADGSPSALSHQGMTSAQVGVMPHLPGPVGLVGVVLGGEVLRLARMADHPAAVGLPAGHVPMGPLLASPITVDGTVVGALYLCRHPHEQPFTAADEQAVVALTRMAGLVVVVRRRLAGSRRPLDGLVTLGLGLTEAEGATPGFDIDQLLTTARTVLGVDTAFLSHVADPLQTFTHVSSAPGAPDLAAGLCIPSSGGYCSAMLAGELPSAVPDTAAHPVTAALPVTAELGIGSYSGVPVVLSDGSTYGTLCALDRAVSDPETAQDRARALAVLARLVAVRIEADRAARERRRDDRALLQPFVDGERSSVVLQPIVDLVGGGAAGYEALSRFTDVHGGPLRPDLVFAEAGRLGAAVELEQAALSAALTLLPRIPAGAYLSVNLSPAAIAAPGTHDLLGRYDLRRVVLEITEHDPVLDYPALARLTDTLRARGARIAVDDAGSGYASLQHINQLRPDVIKLDIALVRDVHRDVGRRALARALVAFATETGAALVAEGIETVEERDQLVALGVRLGQGYLLGRPAPVATLLPVVLPVLRTAQPV